MKLIFDTETTGLVRSGLPLDHPTQPRLVQIAGLLLDGGWNEKASFSFLIQPDGFEVPEQAAAVHGITTLHAQTYGIPLLTALSVFNNLARVSLEMWAFNAAFDEQVIRSEFLRISKPCALDKRPVKCAMLACKDILKLPPNFDGGDYKWPKLAEAYSFFFDGAVIEKAHDALADVRATVQVMRATEQYPVAMEVSA